MKTPRKANRNKKFVLSPLLLAACNHNGSEDVVIGNTSDEPVVVILDRFQTETWHGPRVLQNFYGEFLKDETEVTVIAEDLDENKYDNPVKQAVHDFQPDVINASWGLGDLVSYPTIFEYDDLPEDDVIKEYVDTGEFLWENGTTLTAAAGNDYASDAVSDPWGHSIFPIIVGAYSQYDGDIYDWSNKGSAVVHFYEQGDGWNWFGTSYSAPRVAAHVASIKSEHPDISESSVRTILEKNSLYDFDSGDYVQKLDEITNMDTSIDVRVRVEAMFEIFEGRNPSEEELFYWSDLVLNQGLGLGEMAYQFAINGVQTDDIPPIERMQAFYHFWLGRESEDNEIVEMFNDLVATNSWHETFDNFIDSENVDTEYSFVYNNYNELLTFDEVTYV